MEGRVLTGVHFMEGDVAIAEGALAAGCNFFAGYPITPATEVAERMALRMPKVGGVFIQMEDEIASIVAIIGASWAGAKSMTATSGPGFSLMMENIGLAIMMETPCVIADIQRAGPSTGLPTLWAQADIMQAKWGSHGDYEIIALAPSSVQECFDLTIEAFNYAEEYRIPVFIMSDAIIGHMTEKVVIPKEEDIKLVERKRPSKPPEDYFPYLADESLIPEMAIAGTGYKAHTTGLTHDERGYDAMNGEAHKKLIERICNKIKKNAEKITKIEEIDTDNADIVFVSYGVSARLIYPVFERLKNEGVKAGFLRLITVWPFPEKKITELSSKCGAFLVCELNNRQIYYEVERCNKGGAKMGFVGHPGGGLPTMQEIYEKAKQLLK